MGYEADLPAIHAYNARRKADSPTRLQTHLGPSPFDGDPFSAKVIVLANNPGWDESVTIQDHRLAIEGYPLPGLAPSAPAALSQWTNRILGTLANEFGAQRVSQRVSILQIIPWASESFDGDLILPSRKIQFNIARAAQASGAIMVIGRSFNIWSNALFSDCNLYRLKNPLGMQLSQGNLSPPGWAAVTQAIQS